MKGVAITNYEEDGTPALLVPHPGSSEPPILVKSSALIEKCGCISYVGYRLDKQPPEPSSVSVFCDQHQSYDSARWREVWESFTVEEHGSRDAIDVLAEAMLCMIAEIETEAHGSH